MKKICIILFLCIALALNKGVIGNKLPSVSYYSLKLRVFPTEQRFEAEARITISNNTGKSISEIPFLLYRLLDVSEVADENGKKLKFTQSIQKFKENSSWQANLVSIELTNPFLLGGSTIISMKYSGSIYGYPEVMQYVKDRIDENFSLLRPDALAYPILAIPAISDLLATFQSKFNYNIQVTVPVNYTAACGGKLVNTILNDSLITFDFESKGPVSRIDIAIAKFKYLSDDITGLHVYYLPEDEDGASNILYEMKRAIDLYSSLFGYVKSFQGYTAIEIPEGWGSQADEYSILQASTSFKGKNISEVYHEISHSWNVKAKPEVERCRWFDEAFAMYFEALAVKAFSGDTVFQNHMDRLRDIWLKRTEKNRKVINTPIADYGKEELGMNSYTKGAWSLYVLHQLTGDKLFNNTMRSFLTEFANKPADFKDFQSLAEKTTNKDLTKFFDEWIFGTESSKLLAEKMSVNDIANRY